MADLEPLTFGIVRGQFLIGVGDGNDIGLNPDVLPLQGWAEFSMNMSSIKVVDALPNPATVFPRAIRCILDAEGRITWNDNPDVPLWTTDADVIGATGVLWKVSFGLKTLDNKDVPYVPFFFELPVYDPDDDEGTAVDLTLVAPVQQPSQGVVIIKGPKGDAGPPGDGESVVATVNHVAPVSGNITLTPLVIGAASAVDLDNVFGIATDAGDAAEAAQTTATGAAAAAAAIAAAKGQPSGYASLDSGGKVPTSQLPAVGLDAEAVRDVVQAQLQPGTGVTIVKDDSGDIITINATNTLDQEGVRDTMVAALIGAGYIVISQDDPANSITITHTAALQAILDHVTEISAGELQDEGSSQAELISGRRFQDAADFYIGGIQVVMWNPVTHAWGTARLSALMHWFISIWDTTATPPYHVSDYDAWWAAENV